MEPDTPHDQIRKEPYNLPAGFEWMDVDVDDDVQVCKMQGIATTKCLQLKDVYTLLNENYVEDDDNMFRFDYSKEFLRW